MAWENGWYFWHAIPTTCTLLVNPVGCTIFHSPHPNPISTLPMGNCSVVVWLLNLENLSNSPLPNLGFSDISKQIISIEKTPSLVCPIGSKQRVPKFLICSPKEFPIAPYFYPICFGNCCPLFTSIGGPNGRHSILQNRTFYFGEPP
jgi:hypothetical protein